MKLLATAAFLSAAIPFTFADHLLALVSAAFTTEDVKQHIAPQLIMLYLKSIMPKETIFINVVQSSEVSNITITYRHKLFFIPQITIKLLSTYLARK